MRRPARELPLRHAVALGLLHGPSELLPVSSSAHTTLMPWLAGWPYGRLDPRLRKSFEVALHAGTAAALLLRPPSKGPRHDGDGNDTTAIDSDGPSRPRVATRLGFLVAGLAPPALVGYTLGVQIERKLGEPATIAGGLLIGSVAMGAAELYATRSFPPAPGTNALASRSHAIPLAPTRPLASATARDGLALGLAQALALIPGVSRSGATLAAARARGFSRLDADRLSWAIGLPVIAGATLLQCTRLAREQAHAGAPHRVTLPLTIGAMSAFLSTLISSRMLAPRRRARLLPACVAYRGALATVVIRRMRDNTC
jgi:undecaprenyl-diphosphatase